MTFRPKYITFDCYGTLTYYPMHQAAYDIYEGQLPPQQLQSFIKTFNDYRFDEAMGDWKPYLDVLHSSLERACKKHKLAFRDEHAKRIYDAVPTWGPHADVPHALTRIAKKIPLVILSNAMNEQIDSNVEKLQGALPQDLHGAGCRRLQAALASVRVHARPTRLRAAGHPARVGQSALRHLYGARTRHREQGVCQPRA